MDAYPGGSPTNHLWELGQSCFLSGPVIPCERGSGQVASEVPSASDILSLGQGSGNGEWSPAEPLLTGASMPQCSQSPPPNSPLPHCLPPPFLSALVAA